MNLRLHALNISSKCTLSQNLILLILSRLATGPCVLVKICDAKLLYLFLYMVVFKVDHHVLLHIN